MGDQLNRALAERVERHPLTEKGDFLEVTLRYDPATLQVAELKVTSGKAANRRDAVVQKGQVREARRLDDWAPRKTKPVDYTIENLWWAVMGHVIEALYPDPDPDLD